MGIGTSKAVDRRIWDLGRELYARIERYSPPLKERAQDWLMVALMKDRTLRSRALRFVDVLAALPRDHGGKRTAALFREYFSAGFPKLPAALRAGLALARSPLVPDPVIAWGARTSTHLVANRFIVRPDAATLDRALSQLEQGSRHPSFDLLGEAVLSEEEAREYKDSYLFLLDHLGKHPLARQRTAGDGPSLEVSLKLSSLTPVFSYRDPEGTARRIRPALEEICHAAQSHGIGVTVDAEQYYYRDLVWDIFRRVMASGESLGLWKDAGMVVQAYLRDGEEHAREVLKFAHRREVPFRVRLVKGAYWDYEVIQAEQNGWPVPVFQDKGATDISFERIVAAMLDEAAPIRLAVGSHNIRSHAFAEATREALGLPEHAVEHQTLHRTLEALSRALAEMGWATRDYMPAGELMPGMAYLVRRILENTSQAGFLAETRLHEDVEALLRQPEPGHEDRSYPREQYSTGFTNTPTTRLFIAPEREQFGRALAETRARWGALHALELGPRRLETRHRVPSLSPSHPDPLHPVGWVYQAGPEETREAITLANEAASGWASMPASTRVAVGMRAANLLRARKDEVAAWVVHEGGRTWSEALADVDEAIDHIDWNARQARRLAPVIEGEYRPCGVVACIPPWNFPVALPAGMVSAALLAGNAVILKSAEQTPIVAQALVDAFHDAGVPMAALIHLPGTGEQVGAALVNSPEVDMVAFTGSKKVGTWIYEAASAVAPTRGGIKRVVAEMGGKNAIVVFPDADMDEAVTGILSSAFGHAGQKCSACSRVLIHRDIHERLVGRLVEAARSLPVGPAEDPATVINPIISEEARKGILAYAKVARAEGRVLLDLLESPGPGYALGPMIVEVDAKTCPSARIMREEVFGPLLPVAAFQTEAEAVELVNGTPYALTLGIFSRSPGTVARMLDRCRAGNIYVNRGTTGARVGIEPFGGFQLSGTGPKAGGEEYMLAFLARREGFRPPRSGGEAKQDGAGGNNPPVEWVGHIKTWEEPPRIRVQRLAQAARRLAHERRSLHWAIGRAALAAGEELPEAADHMLQALGAVLGAVGEIAEPQPTVVIPGQVNYIRWDTPRGIGIAAVDEGSNAATLAALIFGPLLAGNGLVVAVPSKLAPLAQVILDALWEGGTPRASLALALDHTVPEVLAAGLVHFAAADLALDRTRALYRVLGRTREEQGQQWLKALLSVGEGPRPGEAGFLRQFAHPKLVAINTLRLGAELELV